MTHPPFNPNAFCPKCRHKEVRTAHFPARAHEGCPFYGQNAVIANNIATVLFDGTWKPGELRADKSCEEWKQSYDERTSAPEHFDRRCVRCGYGWVEGMPATADAAHSTGLSEKERPDPTCGPEPPFDPEGCGHYHHGYLVCGEIVDTSWGGGAPEPVYCEHIDRRLGLWMEHQLARLPTHEPSPAAAKKPGSR